MRIGIGHPGPGRKDLVTPHVLGNYAKSEMEPLSDMLAAIAAEAEWLADGDDARFMSEVALQAAAGVAEARRPKPLAASLAVEHLLELGSSRRLSRSGSVSASAKRMHALAQRGSSSSSAPAVSPRCVTAAHAKL